jgi:hypothetical protein
VSEVIDERKKEKEKETVFFLWCYFDCVGEEPETKQKSTTKKEDNNCSDVQDIDIEMNLWCVSVCGCGWWISIFKSRGWVLKARRRAAAAAAAARGGGHY